MANIVLKDANGDRKTYSDVSELKIKNTDGEYTSFIEKEDVGNGTYRCLAIDYDGTVLKEKWLNSGDVFELPKIPSHDRLVFEMWSSPLDVDGDRIVVVDFDLIVMPIYTTKSGLSEFDIILNESTGLTVTLNMSGTKDWGDGTSDTATSHTYADYGNYTIICDGDANSIGSSTNLFGSSSTGSYPTIGNRYCTDVRFGDFAVSLKPYMFQDCYSLRTVSISSATKITNSPSQVFKKCYRLTACRLPDTLTTFGYSMFNSCYWLKYVIANNAVNVGNYTFSACYELRGIMMQRVLSVTSGNSLNMPFENCLKMERYDFTKNTTIPTVSMGGSPFAHNSEFCKIYVPDALYDEWITTTNWVVVSPYIYKASEMEV